MGPILGGLKNLLCALQRDGTTAATTTAATATTTTAAATTATGAATAATGRSFCRQHELVTVDLARDG